MHGIMAITIIIVIVVLISDIINGFNDTATEVATNINTTTNNTVSLANPSTTATTASNTTTNTTFNATTSSISTSSTTTMNIHDNLSTNNNAQPFTFVLRKLTERTVHPPSNAPLTAESFSHTMIAGWAAAIPSMSVGERATIIIAANAAYGDNGVISLVPPKSPLIYEIEVVAINDVPVLPYPKTWWKVYEDEDNVELAKEREELLMYQSMKLSSSFSNATIISGNATSITADTIPTTLGC